MTVLETNRLSVRKLTVEDAPFILRLVNEPSWLRFIGDRGVHSLTDAQKYILNGPLASYERFGFGLYLVQLKEGQIPIGMCGLLKRDVLEDVDIGYALLPEFCGKGYAQEAAAAVLALGRSTFGLKCIAAVVAPDNQSSIKLLKKLGFHYAQMVRLSPDDIELEMYLNEG